MFVKRILDNITVNNCYFNKPLLKKKNGIWYSGNMWNFLEFYSALCSTLKINGSSFNLGLKSAELLKKMSYTFWDNCDDYNSEYGTIKRYYIDGCFHIRDVDLERFVKDVLDPILGPELLKMNIVPNDSVSTFVNGPPLPKPSF